MGIPEKINEIVATRKQRLPHIEKVERSIAEVQSVVKRLEYLHEQTKNPEVSSELEPLMKFPEVVDTIRLLDTSKFNRDYEAVHQTLKWLKNRFARERVHISFVGRAGQGKSLIMQNISGLSGDIIPSSDGSDCTGAKSIITNNENSDVCAEITFYTREEYLKIVVEYLDEIFGKGSIPLSSVEQISTLKANDLSNRLLGADAKAQSLYDKLEQYIEHTDADLLARLGTTIVVPAPEIEQYVAQYSHTNKNQKYYKYLGVKVANIMCTFPCKECGSIVLVDTIGLGATSLNLREQMLQTVRDDSDMIVLMDRPDAQRPRLEAEDVSIVKDIGDKMNKDYTRRLLFWVLNKVKSGPGRNEDGIPEIKARILQRDYPIAGVMVVDCFQREEVEQNFLLPALEELSKSLPNADDDLLSLAQAELDNLYEDYHEIVKNLNASVTKTVNANASHEFAPYVDGTIGKLTNAIRDLYLLGPYAEHQDEPSEEFKNGVEQKLRNLFIRLADAKKVAREKLDVGTINQFNAYEYMTDRMRLEIIDDFLSLNVPLHELVLNMKRSVVQAMIHDGQLDTIVRADPSDPDAWLDTFIGVLEDSQEDYVLLKAAVHKLREFDIKMEGVLIYKVRKSLSVIDLSMQKQGPELRGDLAHKDELAEDILTWLKDAMEKVSDEIRKGLSPLYSYPNGALWAAIKDYYDRTVYAQQGDPLVPHTVQTEWKYFYQDNLDRVWPKEYRLYLERRGHSKVWNDLVDEARKCDNKSVFSI